MLILVCNSPILRLLMQTHWQHSAISVPSAAISTTSVDGSQTAIARRAIEVLPGGLEEPQSHAIRNATSPLRKDTVSHSTAEEQQMNATEIFNRSIRSVVETPIPLWVRIAATAWTAVLIPAYWLHYGPANFLWFSDIALFGAVLSLWIPNRLIPAMMCVAVLVVEIGWNISFFIELMTGMNVLELTAYMFEDDRPRLIRGLSLFHVWLPPLLLWMVLRWGYTRRALIAQIALACIVFPLTYWVTEPGDSENWVHGPGGTDPWFDQPWYLISWMVILMVVIYLPTHLLLIWLDRRAERTVDVSRSPKHDSLMMSEKIISTGNVS
jgi:hypothetical protein